MADYTINKFTYGGNTYNFDDSYFVVSFTAEYDSSTEQYELTSIDKTASELIAAYNDGKQVVAKVNFGGMYDYILTTEYVGDVGSPSEPVISWNFGLSMVASGYLSDYYSLDLSASLVNGLYYELHVGYPIDQYVDVQLATTTKAYLLGAAGSITSTARQTTAVADTGVYLDTVAGKLTATSFNGSGANLSSINASNISSGTIPAARINGAAITTFNASNISTGTVPAARINGSTLSGLNASNISSGTLATARLNTSGVTAGNYGPTADIAPNAGANFSVPYITVDTYGRVTSAVTRNVTMAGGATIQFKDWTES